MVELIFGLIGLLVFDFIIAFLIRRSGFERAFESIMILSAVLPLFYFILDWNVGVQNGTYTIDDLNGAILSVVLFGLGFAFSGGIIGFFVGGMGKSNSSY
jgi:hypothetical protein